MERLQYILGELTCLLAPRHVGQRLAVLLRCCTAHASPVPAIRFLCSRSSSASSSILRETSVCCSSAPALSGRRSMSIPGLIPNVYACDHAVCRRHIGVCDKDWKNMKGSRPTRALPRKECSPKLSVFIGLELQSSPWRCAFSSFVRNIYGTVPRDAV